VVVCLRNINVAAERDYVLLAQVCGYIQLDPKWSKSNDKTPSFVQTPVYPFDHSIQMPQKSVPNSYCIFLTPREVLSTTQINDSGVFLMFSLPIDLIPTYKGLSGSVSYSLILSLQSPGNSFKQIRFPITVLGSGSLTVPYEIRFSNLASFGARSVPIENPLLPPHNDDSDDDLMSDSPAINDIVYNIRDKDLICALSIISKKEALHPGTYLTISLSFVLSKQPCRAVRAYLQQCENRINGSRVQDKVLMESSRSTIGAELLHLRLHFPDNMACTFSSPLFKVSYQIVLEFFIDSCPDSLEYLGSSNNDKNKNTKKDNNFNKMSESEDVEPFTWCLPIDVMPLKSSTDVTDEVNLCLDPVSEYIQVFSEL